MKKLSYYLTLSVCCLVFVLTIIVAVVVLFNNRITYAASGVLEINDPYYSEQWALNGEYGIDIEGAWEISKGSSSVRVGIIDSGINAHEDIDAQNVDEGVRFLPRK